MILSNVEVQKAIDEGRLIITPTPQAADYDTTAVDLHLGLGWLFLKVVRLITI
jgi:hypothetical protein